MSKNIVIAIDGPAGSGKSTAAKNLAERLGLIYVDTGAMYRAITYLAIQKGIVNDRNSVIELARNVKLKLKFENGITRVFVNNKEITDKIRSAEINDKVSDISKIPEVRAELVKIQRKLGEDGNLIAEGRDTTTVVFPDADLKIYLTASIDERARRRHKEFLEKGINISLDEVKANLEKRDKLDSERDVSPLKKADDAIEFDNTNISIADEIETLLKKIKEIDK
ncbi:(d)CMP kinase [Melioribacteraceae bacterium 4301-Me]|uniref:(d)CMP kinase n=1 Tax=Pyranulibacter aquaticus TaxID=3163344 RepID=UPI00359572C4